MTEYPRTVVLESDKLKTLIQEKTDLVLEGREKSEEIELLQNSMKAIDKEIQTVEKSVDTSDIDAEAKEVTEQMNGVMKRMEEVKAKLTERLKAVVPAMLIEQYTDAEKRLAELEEERRKIGLKVQKKNDKIIPLGQKLMKPFIENEYEDYDTLRLEEGKVVATIFSHLDMFEKNHARRLEGTK